MIIFPSVYKALSNLHIEEKLNSFCTKLPAILTFNTR